MNELLESIKYNNKEFPEQELKYIIEHRENFIPEFLKILKNAKENYEEILEDEEYFIHIYALYLLAEFKEKKAFSLIIDLFSLPGEILYQMFGEFITEDLCRIMASVCGDDIDSIKKFIENNNIDVYMRIAGINTFVVLLAEGMISRDEVVKYYKSLFQGKLEREHSEIWSGLINACCDIHPEEFYEDIKKLYEDDLVEDMYICLEDVEDVMKFNKEHVVSDLKNQSYHTFITDTISELKSWASFERKDIIPLDRVKYKEKSKRDNKKKKNKKKQAKASKKKQRKK